MTAKKMIDVTVTVADDHVASIDAVADRLRQCGLEVHHTLGATGLIAGAAPADALDTLRRLPGVAAVEVAGDVQLPPPGAPVQ